MKKLISSLVPGLILTFNVSCGQSDITNDFLSSEISNVSTLSKKSQYSVQELKFATYNIRNLFDGVQNPGKEPEKPKPENELKALADSIKEINADVIALQEVESKSTLKAFVSKYIPEMNYEVILREGNDGRGIDVAILTKLPVLNIKNYKNVKVNVPGSEPQLLSRDLLQVKLKANDNYTFTTFVTHLKSHHGGDQADIKREAEAKKIRQLVKSFVKSNPSKNYILAGDFNDTYDSKPLRPLLDPKVSDLNLTDIIFKDLGTAQHVYTYHPQKFRSRIDYILVSPTMMKEYINKSVYIHKTSSINENKFIFFEASDHLPVTAKFNVSQDL